MHFKFYVVKKIPHLEKLKILKTWKYPSKGLPHEKDKHFLITLKNFHQQQENVLEDSSIMSPSTQGILDIYSS